jgi:hypothetical protein
MSEPETATPTLQEIQSRSDSLGEEVSRFWNTVCEDARSRAGDDEERAYICAIE